jgi:hypothetical protein
MGHQGDGSRVERRPEEGKPERKETAGKEERKPEELAAGGVLVGTNR